MKGILGLIGIILLVGFTESFVKAVLLKLGFAGSANEIILSYVGIFFVFSVLFITLSERSKEREKEKEYENELRRRKKVEKKFNDKNR